MVYAGGGYTIMFYTIEFHMFVCDVQHMNICSCVHMILHYYIKQMFTIVVYNCLYS